MNPGIYMDMNGNLYQLLEGTIWQYFLRNTSDLGIGIDSEHQARILLSTFEYLGEL